MASATIEHLPTVVQRRCVTCGEYILPGGGQIAGGEGAWRHYRAQDCDANRARLATVAVEVVLMYDALDAASRTLWALLREHPHDEWADEVFDALEAITRGLAASEFVAFEVLEAP